jgi:hypothetical protein
MRATLEKLSYWMGPSVGCGSGTRIWRRIGSRMYWYTDDNPMPSKNNVVIREYKRVVKIMMIAKSVEDQGFNRTGVRVVSLTERIHPYDNAFFRGAAL